MPKQDAKFEEKKGKALALAWALQMTPGLHNKHLISSGKQRRSLSDVKAQEGTASENFSSFGFLGEVHSCTLKFQRPLRTLHIPQ